MKRIVALIIAVCLISIGLLGCDKKLIPKQVDDNNIEEPIVETDPNITDFFEKIVSSDERNIAVMIDNDTDTARPQIGIDKAYLVYEIVVEGGATRFMALYKNEDISKIGPVRSSRHYFLDYAMESDCIYTHFGWSPNAAKDISSYGINNINGVLGGDGNVFWRESKITKDWHTAYTSIKNIKEYASSKKYSLKTDNDTLLNYSNKYATPESDTSAQNISIPYANFYITGYVYDEETKLYTKTINGKDHVMQDDSIVKPKNIIIMFVSNHNLGDGTQRQDINNIGSGNGYYISEGKLQNITWKKDARDKKTVYMTEDGNELAINPGATFINFVNPSLKITIQ